MIVHDHLSQRNAARGFAGAGDDEEEPMLPHPPTTGHPPTTTPPTIPPQPRQP